MENKLSHIVSLSVCLSFLIRVLSFVLEEVLSSFL